MPQITGQGAQAPAIHIDIEHSTETQAELLRETLDVLAAHPLTQGATVDVTQSHDPFAPEGTGMFAGAKRGAPERGRPAAEAPEDAQQGAQEPAAPEPGQPVLPDGSEAQSEPAPADPTPAQEPTGPAEPASDPPAADQAAEPEPEPAPVTDITPTEEQPDVPAA